MIPTTPKYFPDFPTRTFSYLTQLSHPSQEIDTDTRLPSHPLSPLKCGQLRPYGQLCPARLWKEFSSESATAFGCHVSSVSFSLEISPSFLDFHVTLSLSKIPSHLIGRLSFSLGWSDVPSCLDSACVSLAKLSQK